MQRNSDLVVNTDRHYIKPFNHIKENILFDIVDASVIKTIDVKKIEENITANKAAFEYDASNYAKYVFLLNEFEKREIQS